MLAHKCKNLTNVRSMNFHGRLSVHSPDMDEYIVEVTRCKSSTGINRFVTHLLNVAGALLSPCGITSHYQIIPLRVLTSVYGMSRSRIRISIISMDEKKLLFDIPSMITSFLGIGV